MTFSTSYQPLSADHLDWGDVAVLPWDSATFGFPVADYRVGPTAALARADAAFDQALACWAASVQVELISTSLDGNDRMGCALLQRLGFTAIDATLTITLGPLKDARFPPSRAPVRLATAADGPSLEELAWRAFRHGRYHADARFPRDLANQRYRHWMRRVVAAATADDRPTANDVRRGTRVYVCGPPGDVRAFLHVDVESCLARIGIQAVDPDHRGFTTLDVATGAMLDLQASGIQRIVSSVSAANTGILNLAAAYGYRFSRPRTVFHWHAPGAPHLLPLREPAP